MESQPQFGTRHQISRGLGAKLLRKLIFGLPGNKLQVTEEVPYLARGHGQFHPLHLPLCFGHNALNPGSMALPPCEPSYPSNADLAFAVRPARVSAC